MRSQRQRRFPDTHSTLFTGTAGPTDDLRPRDTQGHEIKVRSTTLDRKEKGRFTEPIGTHGHGLDACQDSSYDAASQLPWLEGTRDRSRSYCLFWLWFNRGSGKAKRGGSIRALRMFGCAADMVEVRQSGPGCRVEVHWIFSLLFEVHRRYSARPSSWVSKFFEAATRSRMTEASQAPERVTVLV